MAQTARMMLVDPPGPSSGIGTKAELVHVPEAALTRNDPPRALVPDKRIDPPSPERSL